EWPEVTVRSGRLGPDTVKLPLLKAEPPGVITEIRPVVALVGTTAVIFVFESTMKTESAPLNRTAEVPLKFVPVMMTFVFASPLAGLKLVMLGDCGLETLSILARNAEAIVPGSAVKKLRPESFSI